MFYSFTHFKVKAWWALPLFQFHAVLSYFQANRAKGLLDMKVWPEKGRVFCTLTHWKDKDSMLNFRNNGAHLKAKKLHTKMGEGYSVSWEADREPDKEDCQARLKARLSDLGKLSWLMA